MRQRRDRSENHPRLRPEAPVCHPAAAPNPEPSILLLGAILFVIPMSPGLANAETIRQSDNDTSAINDVLAKGGQAVLLNNGKPYLINDPLVFAAGAELTGQPGTVIEMAVPKPFFKIPAGAHDVKIRDITFDGTMLHAARPAIACYAPNFSWVGGGMRYGAPLFLLPGCDSALIQRVTVTFSSSGRSPYSRRQRSAGPGFGIREQCRIRHMGYRGLERLQTERKLEQDEWH